METASKSNVSSTVIENIRRDLSDNYSSNNGTDAQPFELVELFYNNGNSSPLQQLPGVAGNSSASNVMQMIETQSNVNNDNEITQESVQEFHCKVCERTFRAASHFAKHTRGALCRKIAQRNRTRKRKETLARLDQGGDVTIGRKALKLSPPTDKPFQCSVCTMHFCDRINVELHVQRQHDSQRRLWVELTRNGGFSCAECGTWCQDRGELPAHVRQHRQQSLGYLHPAGNRSGTVLSGNPNLSTPVSTGYFPDVLEGQVFATQLSGLQPGMQLSTSAMAPMNQASYGTPFASTSAASEILSSLSTSDTTSDVVVKSLLGIRNDRMLTHSRWHICGDCGVGFVDPINLELHISRKHPQSYLLETVNLGHGTVLFRTNNTPSDASAFLSTNDHSREHIRLGEKKFGVKTSRPVDQNRPNGKFQCLLCGYVSVAKGQLIQHLEQTHYTTCGKFLQSIGVTNSGKKHKKRTNVRRKCKVSDETSRNPRKQRCDVCGKIFFSKVELVRHRIKDRWFKCQCCGYQSCNDELLTEHVKQHSTQTDGSTMVNPFTCWICGHAVATAEKFDAHLATHDGQLTAKCLLCGKTSAKLAHLLAHLDATLSCPAALKPGQMSSQVLVEMSIDGPVRSVHCIDISKSGHHAAEPARPDSAYACGECGICLATPAQLEAHLRIHRGTPVPIQSQLGDSTPLPPNPKDEFRCQECGFWRPEREPVIRHIQAAHMSGDLVQTQHMTGGSMMTQLIHVVTPISTMVTV